MCPEEVVCRLGPGGAAALQSDLLLFVSQLQEREKPWLNPTLGDVVPSREVINPPDVRDIPEEETTSTSNGAVAIFNGYTERTDYVCKVNCEAGFHTPSEGGFCQYPYADKEYTSSRFEVLVNVDHFEFLQWVEDSYGLSRTNHNGDTHWTYITGTYNDVSVGEINAVVERCQPVPHVMRWCVTVVLAVLQLCSPALQSDPLLFVSQLQDGQEKPKPWLNPTLGDVVPSREVINPPDVRDIPEEETTSHSSPIFGEHVNLKWVQWNGSLPDGAVAIFNGYTERTDYVCKVNCEAGFHTPSKGGFCQYPYADKEYTSSRFEVLVNVDHFEFLQWVEDSYGSVPKYSVKTCPKSDIYVGKNKYGLGKVVTQHEAFFLPWEGDEYWYKSYQVLAINRDSYSQHISHVEYAIDQMELFHHPPEALKLAKVTNLECRNVEKTVVLEKTSTVEKTWDIGRETRNGSVSTMKAKVPILGPGTVDFTKEQTVTFSEGTTTVESISHSVSVELLVPPNHSCTVRMDGRKMTADIPFTGRLSRTNHNGDTHWTYITGTYDDVNVGEINAVVERCQPVPDAVPCPQAQD
ncbi:putative natterin-3-like [Scophthalmus maximus]|uniref:Putative natterin-3-like n=2 Tax=Scophthalmus maximus TaxID=52904 RepID=A0A2U9BWH2_SCOMX|nr:putative natterin-3-like [Scophthalmus maximus]